MLARPNESTPYEKSGFTGSLYFNTDDVDKLWEQLKDKVEVSCGIENFHYGMREFAVYDNNGYVPIWAGDRKLVLLSSNLLRVFRVFRG